MCLSVLLWIFLLIVTSVTMSLISCRGWVILAGLRTHAVPVLDLHNYYYTGLARIVVLLTV